LPEEATDALGEASHSGQEASDALKRGDVDRGLERQREAQHQLEMAREAMGDDPDGEGSGGGAGGNQGNPKDRVDIPKADAAKGAEQFRKRVLKGLSQTAGGREKDAVKRYAEGLLR
jgi:hypothetical protein